MTGHFDCCGQMIREGDKVVTVSGEAEVLFRDGAWRLQYEDGHLEPMNSYGKDRIRRVQQ